MSDAETIRKLRAWARDMREARQEAIGSGAAYHLADTGSVIDTLTAFLDGDATGGWQCSDAHLGHEIRSDIHAGKMGYVGGVGYGPPEKP